MARPGIFAADIPARNSCQHDIEDAPISSSTEASGSVRRWVRWDR